MLILKDSQLITVNLDTTLYSKKDTVQLYCSPYRTGTDLWVSFKEFAAPDKFHSQLSHFTLKQLSGNIDTSYTDVHGDKQEEKYRLAIFVK